MTKPLPADLHINGSDEVAIRQDLLMVALGKSVFDYHSEQVRSHQADWAPIFKWIRKVS